MARELKLAAILAFVGLLADALEPAALCTAGSTYVRREERGFPCSGRGLTLRGSDVEIRRPFRCFRDTEQR